MIGFFTLLPTGASGQTAPQLHQTPAPAPDDSGGHAVSRATTSSKKLDGPASWGLMLLLALALALVRGLIYAVVTPPWQAPDETGHFEYAWLIAHGYRSGQLSGREDALPDADHGQMERELVSSLYEWRYGDFTGLPLPDGVPDRLDDLPEYIHARRSRTVEQGRFSLAYLWQALFLYPLRHQDLTFQLFAARFSSVLLNVGIVWLAFRTFAAVIPAQPPLVWAMTAVVVFLPQHTFINSTVGDGTLAEFMVCLTLCCWVRVFQQGARATASTRAGAWTVVGILGGTVAALWSKTTAAFLVPLDAGLALWWLVRQQKAWSWRQVAYLAGGGVVLGVAVWALGFFRSPLGSRALGDLWVSLSGGEMLWTDVRGLSLADALILSHDSFWAYFGWMAVPIGPRWYGAALLVLLISALGWVPTSRLVGVSEKEGHLFPEWAVKMMGGAFLTALAVFICVALLLQSSGYYQFQGRYLFPVVIPFAFLLVGGLARITADRSPSDADVGASDWQSQSAHAAPVRMGRRQLQRVLVWSGVVSLAAFDLWCILDAIVPYFYAT